MSEYDHMEDQKTASPGDGNGSSSGSNDEGHLMQNDGNYHP